ncbi:MAG: hypothetical protein HC862_07390 [Scytonema sp. RU_4_4]|nr:hypothetical protein [Scytonema sp. RU_4_4]NJR75281.1 hypothetical protein [Scytonema sp. CRU_2_7]
MFTPSVGNPIISLSQSSGLDFTREYRSLSQAQQSSASGTQVNAMVEALRLAAPKSGIGNDGY